MPSKKPTSVKNAVIAKTVAGHSKTAIAQQLGITRNTVRRILDESEINQIIGESKSELYRLVPHATRKYAQSVKKSASEAKEFLERISVLPSMPSGEHGGGTQINFSVGAFAAQALTPNASSGS